LVASIRAAGENDWRNSASASGVSRSAILALVYGTVREAAARDHHQECPGLTEIGIRQEADHRLALPSERILVRSLQLLSQMWRKRTRIVEFVFLTLTLSDVLLHLELNRTPSRPSSPRLRVSASKQPTSPHPLGPPQIPRQLPPLPPREFPKLPEPDLVRVQPPVRLHPPPQVRTPPRAQPIAAREPPQYAEHYFLSGVA